MIEGCHMMRLIQYSDLKKELLCYGIRLTDAANAYIENNGLYKIDNKNVHPSIIQLENGEFVNAVIGEEFTKVSPYSVDVNGNKLVLLKNQVFNSFVNMNKIPKWYNDTTSDGIRMGDILALHGRNTLALSSHNSCYYKEVGKGCLFCTSDQGSDYSPELLAKHICEILSQAYKENPDYSLALSGGTRKGADGGLQYFCEVVKAIKKEFPQIRISVESVAPSDLLYVDRIIETGISSLIMNLEFSDIDIRKKMCPGKSELAKELYYKAYERAVTKLGKWNVGSVLIAGIEPKDNTIKESIKLINSGVTPTIMPFRPYDECAFNTHPLTDARVLIDIEKELVKYLVSNKIIIKKSHACLNCNACIGVDVLS